MCMDATRFVYGINMNLMNPSDVHWFELIWIDSKDLYGIYMIFINSERFFWIQKDWHGFLKHLYIFFTRATGFALIPYVLNVILRIFIDFAWFSWILLDLNVIIWFPLKRKYFNGIIMIFIESTRFQWNLYDLNGIALISLNLQGFHRINYILIEPLGFVLNQLILI